MYVISYVTHYNAVIFLLANYVVGSALYAIFKRCYQHLFHTHVYCVWVRVSFECTKTLRKYINCSGIPTHIGSTIQLR